MLAVPMQDNGDGRSGGTDLQRLISMRLCDPRVAATQFTLDMATANFGISVAAWVLGCSRQSSGLPMMFVVVFALHLVGLMLVVLVKFPDRTVGRMRPPRNWPSVGGPKRSLPRVLDLRILERVFWYRYGVMRGVGSSRSAASLRESQRERLTFCPRRGGTAQFVGEEAVPIVREKLLVGPLEPLSRRSAETLNQHQIAGFLIDLRVEE